MQYHSTAHSPFPKQLLPPRRILVPRLEQTEKSNCHQRRSSAIAPFAVTRAVTIQEMFGCACCSRQGMKSKEIVDPVVRQILAKMLSGLRAKDGERKES